MPDDNVRPSSDADDAITLQDLVRLTEFLRDPDDDPTENPFRSRVPVPVFRQMVEMLRRGDNPDDVIEKLDDARADYRGDLERDVERLLDLQACLSALHLTNGHANGHGDNGDAEPD